MSLRRMANDVCRNFESELREMIIYWCVFVALCIEFEHH